MTVSKISRMVINTKISVDRSAFKSMKNLMSLVWDAVQEEEN